MRFLAPAEEDKPMTSKTGKQPGTGAETGDNILATKSLGRHPDETLSWPRIIFWAGE